MIYLMYNCNDAANGIVGTLIVATIPDEDAYLNFIPNTSFEEGE